MSFVRHPFGMFIAVRFLKLQKILGSGNRYAYQAHQTGKTQTPQGQLMSE
jgi:hypothetical protein